MAEIHRIYLDQMFRLDVAEVLRNQDYDVVRASETGHARADDRQILERSIDDLVKSRQKDGFVKSSRCQARKT